MDSLKEKKAFICDMDGVIYHGNLLLKGAREFLAWLEETGKEYIFLTNSSERSPRELRQKLLRLGLDVAEEHFYTSALATAAYLKNQCPGGSVYVIGEPGLVGALYEAGLTMNDVNPDYVVVGETGGYSYEKILKAVHLVRNGAKLIGTNPDLTGPIENGIAPATRALIAPIELTTGRAAYFIGKPNPLMMRHAQRRLGTHRSETVIVGDRMDTDIIAGIESEMDTILVLSGVTSREIAATYPYQPHYILDGVGQIPALCQAEG
ncbi:MAG: HAD-IIA family hydrolase [Eubacteriales bacterium]|nr:HAD-IIA family hydrolase [Eubacteriales bacterium]